MLATRALTIRCFTIALVLVACTDDAPSAGKDAGDEPDASLDDFGGGDAGEPDDGETPAADAGAERPLLSASGLYRDIARGTRAEDVREFTPRAALWSDAAVKRRFVYLPPGSQIDSREMDGWVFPVGTKLWKEYSLDGTRLETRLLEKTTDEGIASELADDEGVALLKGWLDELAQIAEAPDAGVDGG